MTASTTAHTVRANPRYCSIDNAVGCLLAVCHATQWQQLQRKWGRHYACASNITDIYKRNTHMYIHTHTHTHTEHTMYYNVIQYFHTGPQQPRDLWNAVRHFGITWAEVSRARIANLFAAWRQTYIKISNNEYFQTPSFLVKLRLEFNVSSPVVVMQVGR